MNMLKVIAHNYPDNTNYVMKNLHFQNKLREEINAMHLNGSFDSTWCDKETLLIVNVNKSHFSDILPVLDAIQESPIVKWKNTQPV